MSHTIKTLSVGDITRKALEILHNNLVFVKTINRQYDDRFARAGAKNGGTLYIREPNQFTVRTGAVMDTQDVTESTQTLTLATQKGVDVNFSSVELTLSLDDFAERILNPAMKRLAAEVDKTVIAGCYPEVYNLENTTFGTKPVLADIMSARALLNKGLTPSGDRVIMTESLAANSIISDGKALYNPASEISRQYESGLIGTIGGFKFYESEMTPTHTCGTRTDTTPTCNTSATSTSFSQGGTTIKLSAGATGTTLLPGDTFTIAGLYAVNPETKAVYSHLQQWSVTATADVTTTTTTVYVSPAIYTSGAKQNVSVVTATAAAAVINLTAGGSGSAGVSYVHTLAYHKDAFTFVTADLEMPQGVDFASRKVIDGISLRIVRQYDVVNDKFPCRIDVLFGYKCIRPEWACRLSS